MARNTGVVMGLPSVLSYGYYGLPDETYFRSGLEAGNNDVFVAIMGVTGSGKSTFISLLAEPGSQPVVGHGLEGCTQKVNSYLYKFDENTNVYLIDTPGFDDTNRDDSDVLRDVALWFSESLKRGIKLSGIIYLHRISDRRMTGSAKKNLLMFKKLCGDNALVNVILATTMWETVEKAEGERREKQLKETRDFWGFMMDNGSSVERHYNCEASAKALVDKFVTKAKIELTIQDQMVRENRKLDQTDAGRTLDIVLAEERAKWERRAAQQTAELREALKARDKAAAAALEEERKKSDVKARQLSEERERLKVSLEEMRRTNEETTQRKLKEQQERLIEENKKIMLQILQKQKEMMKLNSDNPAVRVRSHPGENRIQEFRSISLIEDSYYFCGPKYSARNLPPAVEVRLAGKTFDDDPGWGGKFLGSLRSTLSSAFGYGAGVKAFALGTSDSFYLHFHQNGECRDMSFLPDYPGLASALFKHQKSRVTGKTDSGCPRYISLGVNGHYFLNTGSHSVWDIPDDLASQPWWEGKKVRAVWLGMNDAWVVQMKDGRKKYNLKGQYSANERALEKGIDQGFSKQRPGQRIKAMSLNLTDPECFAAAWGDGGIVYNAAGEFDGFIFEEFATKNFGTTFG